MAMLLIAGIGALIAGLVAIGFGIPVKEFGFGNTLILSGTIGVSTGLVLLGLSAIVRELRLTSQLLAANPASFRANSLPAEADERVEPARPSMFQRSRAHAATDAQETADRDTDDNDRTASPGGETSAEARQRRNLLFATSSRRERNAAKQAETADRGESGSPGKSDGTADAAPGEGGLTTFVDAQAWPRAELPQRPKRPPLVQRAEPRARPAAPPEPEPEVPETPAVTVIKSGVVDGMAYSLYSNGSIEAQLPEGMMRFASIDELRDHLDSRG